MPKRPLPDFLSRMMLPIFESDTPNLLMPPSRLNELLREGAHLIGAGLLDVIKSQENRVSAEKVIGLMGTLLAARDYLRRYPGSLLVSTDSQLARMWLRLGKQGERCDMLALREESKSLVLECVEVKSTKGLPHRTDHPEIVGACDQLAATLQAVGEGLGDTSNAEASGRFLAAPRNEMLKEVLVQGCMGCLTTGDQREIWAGWLNRLFGDKPESPELRGSIVDVAISSAQTIAPEPIRRDAHTFQLFHLNEIDVQKLLDPSGTVASGDDPKPTDPDTSGGKPAPEPPKSPSTHTPSVAPKPTKPVSELSTIAPETMKVTSSAAPGGVRSWPPAENAFGLIGQQAAATKLQNKVDLSSGTGRRFTDTLFIGSAGVGKSSLARSVAKRLINDDPIFFSGSDLGKPTALIDRLADTGKISRKVKKGPVKVAGCLVFIDEVHALGKPTLVTLLSAMDDARVATVGGMVYDFADVIFIAATTDKGLLTDAFVSRMDVISLPNYSLEELAGIIWFQGKKLFDGIDLPREVCIEVAARNRCNPRRAVRSLENDLLSYFYSRLGEQDRQKKTATRQAAHLMTVPAVAGFYESSGIDLNGLDPGAKQLLEYLKAHGPVSEDRICKGLRISNRPDFVELIEYLTRLGLVATGHGGRSLTPAGRKYMAEVVDLRSRI